MDVNKILTPVAVRLLNDKSGPGSLGELLGGEIIVYKGPRKPTKSKNSCFTVHVLTAPREPDSKAYNGTLLINFYCDNYTSGNVNVELMGPVTARVIWLFDDKPITVSGWRVYDFHVQEPLGPLQDPGIPDESFMSVRIKFGMIPNLIL
jgi:hypothetical protein